MTNPAVGCAAISWGLLALHGGRRRVDHEGSACEQWDPLRDGAERGAARSETAGG